MGLPGRGFSVPGFLSGRLLCKLIREYTKDVIKDEIPKSCLIAHRYYINDFYSSFDIANKPFMTQITGGSLKEDVLNGQSKDPKTGYKYAIVDTLINFGRLDEEIDAVVPINLPTNLSQIDKILKDRLNIGKYEPYHCIPEKIEGYLFNSLTMAPVK